MPNGTVKWFNKKKGYGFIEPFVHISAVKEAGLFNLDEGDKLTYELETGENGKISAVKLSKA